MSRSSTHSSDPPAPSPRRPLAAIILAAGKGVRMNSDLPKVVHEVAGRPIVWWVVEAVREAGANPIVLVIGHGGEHVRAIFQGDDDDIRYVLQDRQLGTGHATLRAQEALGDFQGDALVLAGDGPLIRPKTIAAMHETQRATGAAATLATSIIEDPTGYGRIIRDSDGCFREIVEHKNATAEQLAVHEIYPSYACFDAERLFAMLRQLKPNEVTGEFYLTDIPAMLRDAGELVELVDAVPPEDVLSINTPQQLAEVAAILTARMEMAQMEKHT